MFVNFTAKASEIEVIKDLIGLYQPEIRKRYGKELYFEIQETETRNAWASITGGPNRSPLLTITSAYLYMFVDDEVINTVCHELGHFLGNISFGSTKQGAAFESEADYFGGSCAVRYYREVRGFSLNKAQETAIHMAKNSRSHVKGYCIDPYEARAMTYNGINTMYSVPECRVLSVLHGIMGWKRPACWFNPN